MKYNRYSSTKREYPLCTSRLHPNRVIIFLECFIGNETEILI